MLNCSVGLVATENVANVIGLFPLYYLKLILRDIVPFVIEDPQSINKLLVESCHVLVAYIKFLNKSYVTGASYAI